MNAPLIATIGSLLVGGSLACGVFFFSSFEWGYTPGQPLAGQGNWVSLVSPNAATVIQDHGKARIGHRAVKCWGGGDLETVSTPYYDLLDGAWEQVVEFPGNSTPDVVMVAADVRLDGPDTGSGPNDDLLSANLYARNGVGRSAFFYVSSNGNAYAFANSEGGQVAYAFETPIHQNAYNNLAIILDYDTHMATFRVNYATVGTLPFGGSGEHFHGALLEFAALDDLSYVDPTQYTAYWDDVLVVGSSN